MRSGWWIVLALAVGTTACTRGARAQADAADARAQADAAAAHIAATVAAGTQPGLRWPRFTDYRHILEGIYEPRAYAPLWLEAGRPSKPAGDALAALAAADAQGLDARDYDAAWLAEEGAALGAGAGGPARKAAFDTALTVGLARYVSDLHIGRVSPRRLGFGYDIDGKKYDLAALIQAAVRGDRIRSTVAEAAPQLGQYARLVAQLARHRELARDGTVGPVTIAPTVHPGDPSDAAPALARWLAALGDLPAQEGETPLVYDGALVEAVRRFQTRHGLAPDAVIGKETAKALAVPAERRVRQIQLALERLRWIPPIERGRIVFVNVPAFELVAFDDVGPATAPALWMRIIVGRAMRTETPVFTGTIRTVLFSPYWNVPRSIVVKEILPKLRRDPGYLAREEMEIVSGGRVLPDDAASAARLAAGGVELRERPGPHNALGRVKFLFPNSYSVYLHDTPGKQAFERNRRDFSHGCIRIAEAEAFANWVLRDRADWPPERIRSAMEAGKELAVPVDPPIAVVVFYMTAVARRDGTISFYDDLYGRDAELERALAKGYPYPP